MLDPLEEGPSNATESIYKCIYPTLPQRELRQFARVTIRWGKGQT